MVESPVIWFDSHRHRFAMVYTGYARMRDDIRGYGAVARPQVGLAWSDDLFHWEKDPRNPIFGPSGIPGSPDAEGTPGPFVIESAGDVLPLLLRHHESGIREGDEVHERRHVHRSVHVDAV